MNASGSAVGFYLLALLLLAPLVAPGINVPLPATPAAPGPAPPTVPAAGAVRTSAAGLSLALVASTYRANPKDAVVVTVYFNNTGNRSAPNVWINVSASSQLTFVGDTAAGNRTPYPRYTFANVGLGLHSFGITFRVAIGTPPGSRLPASATLVYADGMGGQAFVGPSSVTIVIGLETKQLYLGWGTLPPGTLTPAPPTGPLLPAGTFSLHRGGPSVPFDLTPVLARPFRVLNLTATLYVQPVATPTDLDVNLTLIDVNGAATNPVAWKEQVNTVTGSGFWALIYTFPAMDYTFAAGHSLRIDVLNTPTSGRDALLATNATADPSHLDLETTTYVSVDALLPGSAPTTYLSPKSSLVVLANVSDPFGSGEILDARINVTGPSGPVVVWASLLPAYRTDPSNPSAWKLFRYTLSPPLENGTYAFEVTALERNGVSDVAASSVVVRAPAFTFAKLASVPQAKSGNRFTYTVWYNNTGSGPAGLVWVNDTLPAAVSFISSIPVFSSLVGNTYGWAFSNVGVGSNSIQITVQVKGGASGVAYIRNAAALNFSDPQGFLWPGLSSHADVVINGPFVSLGLTSVPSPLFHGNESVVETFRMTNAGDAVQSIWLNVTLPAALAYVSDTSATLGGTRTIQGSQIHFLFGGMPSGNPTPVTWAFTMTVRGAPGPIGGAVATTQAVLTDSSTNGVIMPETGSSLSLTVGAPAITAAALTFLTPSAVSNVSLLLRVNLTNAGNEAAPRVWINLTLDPRLGFVDASIPATVAGSSVRLVLVNASVGDDAAFLNVSAQGNLTDRLILTVTGTLEAADGYGNRVPGRTPAPGSIAVALPDLRFSLYPVQVTAEANTTVFYEIAGGNFGSGTASHVWLNLTLPAGLTYRWDNLTGAPSVVGSDYSWSWTDFAPGVSAYTVALTVSPLAADGTSAVQTYRVQSQDRGHNPRPDSSFSGQTLVVAPEFALVVSADRARAAPGSAFNYTLVATNRGSTAAASLVLTDELDGHLELVTYSSPVPMTAPGSLAWRFSDVQPGGSIQIHLLVQVRPGTPANLQVANSLRAEYTNSRGQPLAVVRSAAATTVIEADLLPLAYILGGGSALGLVVIVLVYRRYRVEIEDVFLIYRDGILISHLSQARGEAKDEDQLSGMLTAVQDFVQDAFTYGQDRSLHELEFGEYHILIERGAHIYLAVVYRGRDSGLIRKKVRAVLDRVEASFGPTFDEWDGDMEKVDGTRELLQEGFLESDRPWSLVKPKAP